MMNGTIDQQSGSVSGLPGWDARKSVDGVRVRGADPNEVSRRTKKWRGVLPLLGTKFIAAEEPRRGESFFKPSSPIRHKGRGYAECASSSVSPSFGKKKLKPHSE